MSFHANTIIHKTHYKCKWKFKFQKSYSRTIRVHRNYHEQTWTKKHIQHGFHKLHKIHKRILLGPKQDEPNWANLFEHWREHCSLVKQIDIFPAQLPASGFQYIKIRWKRYSLVFSLFVFIFLYYKNKGKESCKTSMFSK